MIYILLPVHNRIETTKVFIECLKKQTFTDFHLVLIDDGSTDGTADYVQKKIEHCTIIKGNGNLWWGGSLQKGLDWIRANANKKDHSLFINDDVIFGPDFLKIGNQKIVEHYRTFILAKSFSQQTTQLVDHGVTIRWNPLKFQQAASMEEINCFSTRGLLGKVSDVLSVGKFHPILLPHYLSDYEFTYRAYTKGISLITDNDFFLYKNEDTTGFGNIKYRSFKDIFIKYFSKKNPNNIFYMTSFIVLACPGKYLIKELIILYFKQIKVLLSNYKKLFS